MTDTARDLHPVGRGSWRGRPPLNILRDTKPADAAARAKAEKAEHDAVLADWIGDDENRGPARSRWAK